VICYKIAVCNNRAIIPLTEIAFDRLSIESYNIYSYTTESPRTIPISGDAARMPSVPYMYQEARQYLARQVTRSVETEPCLLYTKRHINRSFNYRILNND